MPNDNKKQRVDGEDSHLASALRQSHKNAGDKRGKKGDEIKAQ